MQKKPQITQKGNIPGDLSLPKPIPIEVQEKEVKTDERNR